jgi:hypothetical protein
MLQLVVNKREDAFDVCRAATESISELIWRDALVAPAQQSTLERSESLQLFGGAATGKTGKDNHTLDVFAAALEASTYLGGDDTGRREPTHSTFEGSEGTEIIHKFHRTASGTKREVVTRDRVGCLDDATDRGLGTRGSPSLGPLARFCRVYCESG